MEYKKLFISILVLYHFINEVNAIGCPPKCTCQQRNVRCIRLELELIPEVPLDTSIM